MVLCLRKTVCYVHEWKEHKSDCAKWLARSENYESILNFSLLWCFSNLRSVFLGERNRICVPSVPVTRIGFLRKAIECKESRIGKQPIQVPSNVTIKLEGQDLKVKGPLGELSRTYPREVKLERDEDGIIRVKKALETRRANQMHGLFR